MDESILQIVLRARDEASKVINDAGNTIGNFSKKSQQLLKDGLIPLGTGFAAVTGEIYSAISAYEESEKVGQQLNAVLASTKGVAGVTADEVLRLSTALQQQSTFDDEAITGAQNLLLTFTNIGKNIFPQATKTVLDMSVALGQDLKSSSIQLGKALQDPILGITALRRVGVNFNDQQQETIKNLVESGHLFEAQKLILQELGTEFGGSALAQAQTFSGQMAILKHNIGDVQETIGKGLLDTLNQMTGGFDNLNKMMVAFNGFLQTHKDVLMGIVIALGVLAATFGVLLVGALVVAAGTFGAFAVVAGGVVAALGFLAGVIIADWKPISAFFVQLWTDIKHAFIDGINTVIRMMNGFIDQINRIQIHIPAVGIGPVKTPAFDWGGVNVAHLGLLSYDQGGAVPYTGLAFLHEGEYVLSRDMLSGRQPIQAPITNTYNRNPQITLGPVYVRNDTDIDKIVQKLSMALKYDSGF
ncbi:MAG TPA: phage tail length tape measure family protein [Chloroflexia bacterium]|nr:phage tail length tape measure family protein [Chloroflexia bacterium]